MSPKIHSIVSKPSQEAARLLLGCEIISTLNNEVVSLRIVETEAYHQSDPASHSFAGVTKRTVPMFQSGGIVYVYFTYGMHYCLNVVTGEAGVGEAVLLRAAEPLSGIEIMMRRRGTDKLTSLANGPGKLAQALGINSTELSGSALGEKISLKPASKPVSGQEILTSARIGISKATEEPWRFYISQSPFISRK